MKLHVRRFNSQSQTTLATTLFVRNCGGRLHRTRAFPDVPFPANQIEYRKPTISAARPFQRKPNLIDLSPSTFSGSPPPLSPLHSVFAARALHQILLKKETPPDRKKALAREIAGILFSAEANAALSNRTRILFLRLRTQAHLMALPNAPDIVKPEALWTIYDELEALL
jgi:hypothetical protein